MCQLQRRGCLARTPGLFQVVFWGLYRPALRSTPQCLPGLSNLKAWLPSCGGRLREKSHCPSNHKLISFLVFSRCWRYFCKKKDRPQMILCSRCLSNWSDSLQGGCYSWGEAFYLPAKASPPSDQPWWQTRLKRPEGVEHTNHWFLKHKSLPGGGWPRRTGFWSSSPAFVYSGMPGYLVRSGAHLFWSAWSSFFQIMKTEPGSLTQPSLDS